MIDAKRAAAILKRLGAANATVLGKAHAQYPMLHRYLLLTGLWRAVLPDDATWTSDGKDAVGQSVAAVLAAGVDPADLTRIVRDAQVELLVQVCELLDRSDHGIEDLQEQIAENVEWRVCEYDGERAVVGRPMNDLHAGVLGYDPTGREGEPKPRRKKPRTSRRARGPARSARSGRASPSGRSSR
ncbi:MAG TPA: hypothetical protein VGG28_03105 [Kofleriaceae bacterium]